jgi:hypothetical protein
MGFSSECKPEDKTKEEGTNVDECLYFVREKEQILLLCGGCNIK